MVVVKRIVNRLEREEHRLQMLEVKVLDQTLQIQIIIFHIQHTTFCQQIKQIDIQILTLQQGKIQMKKNQRSQSSFRAKTQHAQIQDDDTQWMGSINPRKMLKNVNSRIATSFIDQDKQNCGMFQSVSQRVFQNKYSSKCHSQINDMYSQKQSYQKREQKLIGHLQQKCKMYQKQICQLRRQKQRQKSYLSNKQSNQFNYQQRYYLPQIQILKQSLQSKQDQIQTYKSMLKMNQMESRETIAGQLSQRIQKQKQDKNVFIKQINIKNIQINKLQQTIVLLKSQKDTCEIVIKQKQSQIEQLGSQIGQINIKKFKLESYQLKIRDSQNKIKQIQDQTLKLKKQTTYKDQIINTKTRQIQKMEMKLAKYQEEIVKIQENYIEQTNTNKHLQKSFEQLTEKYQKTKQDYFKLTNLKEILKEKQSQLKIAQTSINQLKNRNIQLSMQNQKAKESIQFYQKLNYTVIQYKGQVQTLKKCIKEKDEFIQNSTNNKQLILNLQSNIADLTKLNRELQYKSQNTQKELKQSLNMISHLQSLISELRLQIKEDQQKIDKLQSKKETINAVYNQNQKLNNILHQKLSQSQKHQQRITTLQNKVLNLTNELKKQKTINQEKDKEISKLILEIQQLKRNLANQMEENSLLNEDIQKLKNQNIQIIQDNLAMKQNIQSLQQENCKLSNQLDDVIAETDAKIQRNQQNIRSLTHQSSKLQEQLNRQRQQNNKCKQILGKSCQKIQFLTVQISGLKLVLDQITQKESYHKNIISKMEDLNKQNLIKIENYKKKMMDWTRFALVIKGQSQNMLQKQVDGI